MRHELETLLSSGDQDKARIEVLVAEFNGLKTDVVVAAPVVSAPMAHLPAMIPHAAESIGPVQAVVEADPDPVRLTPDVAKFVRIKPDAFKKAVQLSLF